MLSEAGLSIGAPDRDHILLGRSGLEHDAVAAGAARPEVVRSWPWNQVSAVEVVADVTDRRLLPRVYGWFGAVMAGVGLGFDPPEGEVLDQRILAKKDVIDAGPPTPPASRTAASTSGL